MKYYPRIAIFSPTLRGGGAERVVVNMANGFVKLGISVDLLLSSAVGPYIELLTPKVNIVDLNTGRVLSSLPRLIKYLHEQTPTVFISHQAHANIIAIIAHLIDHSRSKLIVCEHSVPSRYSSFSHKIIDRFIPILESLLYPFVDAIVGVSSQVVNEVRSLLISGKHKVHLIHNPIINSNIYELMDEKPPELYSSKGKIILSVGRLVPVKGYRSLIHAFVFIRKKIDADLFILGEGKQRIELTLLAKELKIEKNVHLLGFMKNPYSFMKNADVFVLSSIYEGLPTVLIEAMACGVPVVSTKSGGSTEILGKGKYGKLVPAENPQSLAKAIVDVLENPPDNRPAQKRSNDFTVDKSIQEYIELINSLK